MTDKPATALIAGGTSGSVSRPPENWLSLVFMSWSWGETRSAERRPSTKFAPQEAKQILYPPIFETQLAPAKWRRGRSNLEMARSIFSLTMQGSIPSGHQSADEDLGCRIWTERRPRERGESRAHTHGGYGCNGRGS
jgi:hypothetical protein